jgi:hypothetical protein
MFGRWTLIVGIVALTLMQTGCATANRRLTLETQPMLNRDVIALEPEDVVAIMRRAGFSGDEIVRLGRNLRNHLAQSGGCRIASNDGVVAMFAVHGDEVYVTSPDRGAFRYDVAEKTLK